MSTILIVDDNESARGALQISLAARGYRVITAEDGNSALRFAAETAPNLVLIELSLPDLAGIDVIRGLRGWTSAPIIALSERDDADQKVRALDVGADDHLTKPFDTNELLARVRAALRRAVTASTEPHSIVDTSSFTVDLDTKKVWREGTEVHLTPTEWALLEVLVRHAGRLVTRRELLETVWGAGHHDDTHYLRVYMGQLRRNLEPDSAQPRHLITEPGRGYRFTITRAD